MSEDYPTSRHGIHYWKCDRADRFRTAIDRSPDDLKQQFGNILTEIVKSVLKCKEVRFLPGGGQGNHVTFRAECTGMDVFIRIEDGPEADDYIEAESTIMERVRGIGLPVPKVIHVDASRQVFPFAIQILENVPYPALTEYWKQNRLTPELARELGRFVGTWQSLGGEGFGFLHTPSLRRSGTWKALSDSYSAYFLTNLEEHLEYLVDTEFLTQAPADEWYDRLASAMAAYELNEGCLVHKDLAVWNLLGTNQTIHAIIDWDDSILGDPMDDIALLGCFHDGCFLASLLRGYQEVRPLPPDYEYRFWLHLARNLIVKAVIRTGMGYFERKHDYFLHNAASVLPLRELTSRRLQSAWAGLSQCKSIESLEAVE